MMNERDLFIAARELGAAEQRAEFLNKACGTDAQLRARVTELLQSEEQAGSFLQQPLLERAATTGGAPPVTQLECNATAAGPGAPDLDFLTPSGRPDLLGTIGPYDITEVVGAGGMGIVLKAIDAKLNRVVAVKVLAPALGTNMTARKRFLREAQAAAAIAHPHIVTISAVDEDQLPYLVMEYVGGLSLQEKIDRDGQVRIHETLRIGSQIAAGLAAAHAQGVIHRDIKPANILLENGVERVRITDFGLARAIDDAAVTRAGEVAGTPQYMSPEQAQGQAVDARSDLFSLGSVLYAMCTGRSPFRAESSIASLRRVCDDTPRPIRDINPETPDWLSAIIEQLLEKSPDDRIQTAAEVADLLHQHLAHLQNPAFAPAPVAPLPRRRPSTTGARRRRWIAAAIALAAATIGLGATEATGVTHLAATVVRIVTGEGTLVIEIDDPDVEVSLDGEELSITGAGLREVRLRPGRYQFRATKGSIPIRQELVTITRGTREIVRVTRESATAADVTPAAAWTGWPADGPPPAIAPFDAKQAAAHQAAWAARLRLPVEYVNSIGMKLRLIPPGEFLMGSPQEESTRIHASAAGWAHDHERSIVLTESPPQRVGLTRPFYVGVHEVTRAEFQKFVDATGYQTLPERTGLGGWAHYQGGWARRPEQVWSTPGEWQPTDDEPVCVVTWSDAVAFCEWLSEVEGRRYALPTEAQWEFACRAGTTTATYAAPDESLATIAWTNELVMSAHPQPVGQKRPNAFGLHDMLGNVLEHCADWYSPGIKDGELQIDPAGPDQGVHRVLRGGAWYRSGYLFARSGARNDFAESSGGSDAGIGFRVAIIGDLRTVVRAGRQLEPGARQPLRTFHHGAAILAAAVAPNDASIVSAGEDHTLQLWNSATGELIRTFAGHSAPIITVAFSNDGRRILSSGWGDTTARLWDVATGQELKRFGHDDAALGTALSPDGTHVATSDHKPTLRLWDAESGEELRRFDLTGLPKVRVIAFSPDGRTLLTGSLDGSSTSVLRLWDVKTGDQLPPLAGHTDWITSVSFSPDGQRALSSSWDRTVRLWDVTSSTELRCFTHTDKVETAALSSDGRQVLSGRHDGTLSLWDVESGNEICRIAAHSAGVWIVAFLSNPARAISASQDGTVRLWNLADDSPRSATTAPEP